MQETAFAPYYTSRVGYEQLMAWYDKTLGMIQVPHRVYTVPTSYGRTQLLEAGRGSPSLPVLLLHGVNINALVWLPQVNSLAGKLWLLAPDIPGYAGRSSAVRLPYTGGHLERWLVDVMDAAQVRRVLLVGASAGGYFALQAAASLPGRVAGVLLLNPTGLAPYRHIYKLTRSARMVHMLHNMARGLVAHRWVARRVVRRGMAPGHSPTAHNVELAYLLLKYYQRRPPPPILPAATWQQVSCPVVLMLSPHEIYTDPQAVARLVRQHLPHARVRFVDTAGHDINKEAPAVTNQAILRLYYQLTSGFGFAP